MRSSTTGWRSRRALSAFVGPAYVRVEGEFFKVEEIGAMIGEDTLIGSRVVLTSGVDRRGRLPDRGRREGERKPGEQERCGLRCAASSVILDTGRHRSTAGRVEAAGVPRLRLRGHRHHDPSSGGAQEEGRDQGTAEDPARYRGQRGHRPHPVGDLRKAVRRERPSVPRLHGRAWRSCTTASSRTTWR